MTTFESRIRAVQDAGAWTDDTLLGVLLEALEQSGSIFQGGLLQWLDARDCMSEHCPIHGDNPTRCVMDPEQE